MDPQSVDTLKCFVAHQLLRRTLGYDPHSAADARFQGAVLIADISGSTRLAEQLCGQGPAGVERLRAVLGRAFASYVECVNLFGGEIAGFSGDALIAYWPADRFPLDWVTDRAQSCARTLQSLSTNDPYVSEMTPDMHIGVGAGDLWTARLGGLDARWKLLLAGAAVREAARAEAAAPEGRMVLGPTAAELTDRRATVDSSANDCAATDLVKGVSRPPLETVNSIDSMLESILPRVVRERFADGAMDQAGELRQVAVLFIRIDGLDERDSGALVHHQQVVRALQQAVHPHSGSSGSLVLDDKGLIFKLTVGLPFDSYPDNAARAIEAGLAAGMALEELGLQWSAGVATGQAFCGVIGATARMDYVATGLPLPVAARLMQSADCGLLCTEDAAIQAGANFEFVRQDPMALKGLRQPISVQRVLGSKRRPPLSSLLLGRDHEQDLLRRQLHRLRNGGRSITWLVGDAGSGKTTLVDALMRAAADERVDAVVGGLRSGEYVASYAAWRNVFIGLLGIGPNAEPERIVEAIRERWLKDEPSRARLPLLSTMFAFEAEDTEHTAELVGELRVNSTLELLTEILTGVCARRPQLIVLEDCHWMDSASWRLVQMVGRQVEGLCLVLTSRPAPEVDQLRQLRGLDGFTEITLGPLDSQAIQDLVCMELGGNRPSTELMSRIETRTRGNPFFVKAYVEFLNRANAVSCTDGLCYYAATADQDSHALPTTVESVIASRIDNLTTQENALLRAASVIGRSFSLELLRASCPPGAGGTELRMLMYQLEQHQMIVAQDAQAEGFAFAHDLIRDVAYDQIPFSERRDLHRAVAHSLEAASSSTTTGNYPRLAHHWSEGDVPELAVKYSSLAAAQALQAGAYVEAEQLLQRCIRLTETQHRAGADRLQLIRWHREIGDARHGLGDQQRRANEVRYALALAGRPRPGSNVGLIAESLWRLSLRQVRRLLSLDRGIAERDWESAREILRCYRHSAYAGYFLNSPIGTLYDSVNAVDLAERLPPSDDLAGAYSELGGFLGVAGFRTLGWRLLGKAVHTAEQLGGATALAHVHMARCLYAVGLGSWRGVEHSVRQCQAYAAVLGDDVRWSTAQIVSFWSHYYRGDLGAAHAAATALRERAHASGNRQQERWGIRAEANCELHSGSPRSALHKLEQCMREHRETIVWLERMETEGLLALAYDRLGQHDKAWSIATGTLDRTKKLRRPVNHALLASYTSICEVLLDGKNAAAHRDQVGDTAARALAELRRYRRFFPIGEPAYCYWLGRYRQLFGPRLGIRRVWERGLAQAQQLGMARECQRLQKALDVPPGHEGRRKPRRGV